MLPSERQQSAGEASGKAREPGVVHGLHLVAFARWDMQQLTQQTKETDSRGFRYSQWQQATVVQTVSFALGWLPEENKVVFRFQKVPANKQSDLMLFNNSRETLQITYCSGCKMLMWFPIFMAVFL